MKKIMYLCICLFVGSANAIPMGFDFYQGGFDDGAYVSGMFTGNDLDSDGQLSSFNGEIIDFMMDFSGNSYVSSFSIGFADLFGLVYDLDGGPLGDGWFEGIGVSTESSYYAAGPGPFDVCGIGDNCAVVAVFDEEEGFESFSAELVAVSSKDVPEPTLLALLGIGLAGFSVSRKRKNV